MLTDLSDKLKAVHRGELTEAYVYRGSRKRPRHLEPTQEKIFFCPVCQSWHRRFLPFGLNARRNAACPNCGSLERHRFMWRHLRDVVGVQQRRLRVLHIAPEPCIFTRLTSQPNLRYLTIDLHNDSADKRMDITALALPDASFDLVVCSHVLEHVEADHLAIAELNRVLRPGGTLIVMVPIDRKREATYEDSTITSPIDRHEAFGHPYHVRICGMDYGRRVSDGGFDVNSIDSRRLSPHRRRVERINKTLLYHCIKSS